MKRRDFFKFGSALSLIAISPTILFSKDKNIRTFDIKYIFDIKNNDNKYPVKLWNPMPYNSSYQEVKYLHYAGNYKKVFLTRQNKYDALTLFSKWDKNIKNNHIEISMQVQTSFRTVNIKDTQKASYKNLSIPKEVEPFLKSTNHIPTTGIIKALANRITRGKKDRFEKVKAIYFWCTSHTFRDKNVVGCGTGDVGQMVKDEEIEKIYTNGYYGGKCTDLSSLFTALVRASGTPAREVFGIRLGKSNFSHALGTSKNGMANISSWQHCRVEYYIPGIGWIPCDPADITKLELVENLQYSDKRVQELNEKYLHSWEMNWIGFNYARDFELYPKTVKYPLNMFGYPYGEVANKTLDYYDPSSFSFLIISNEVK